MCGIGGFSLNESSRVNARQLAHELLVELEYRGTDASGFAYVANGAFGIHKAPKTGSQLPLSELPRNAKTVILHTRFATQGHQSNNRNNHPVVSPKGNIALVHNGVISNDEQFRLRWPDLPQVDSSVIPAIIESDGLAGTKELSGYAAIGWIDATDPTAADVLNIARLDTSPVVYTWLYDGSFVWASTIQILMAALSKCGLDHGYVFAMDEGQMMGIRFGVPVDYEDGLTMTDDWRAYARWGNTTSGGHGAATGNHRSPSGIGSSFGMLSSNESVWDDVSPSNEERMTWEDDYRVRAGYKVATFDPDEVAMAMAPETNDPNGPVGRVWLRNPDTGELESCLVDGASGSCDLTDENKGFYLTLWDGELSHYEDLDDLETYLAWLSGLSMPDSPVYPDAPPALRWTNQIMDIGDITVRGGMQSWIEDMARIDYYESDAVYHLDYIRDGVAALITAHQS